MVFMLKFLHFNNAKAIFRFGMCSIQVNCIPNQMTTYIAQFVAKHRLIQIEQNSIFTWRQEGGEIDESLLIDKIKRESAIHFYNLIAGSNYEILSDDILVNVWITMPFPG